MINRLDKVVENGFTKPTGDICNMKEEDKRINWSFKFDCSHQYICKDIEGFGLGSITLDISKENLLIRNKDGCSDDESIKKVFDKLVYGIYFVDPNGCSGEAKEKNLHFLCMDSLKV